MADRGVVQDLLDSLELAVDAGDQRVWAVRCARVLGLEGMAVSLTWGDELVWFSDDISARLADTQFTLGQGPGLTDFGVVPYLSLNVGGAADEQWPQFAAEARALGVRAVFVWPVRAGAEQIGTLTGYRNMEGPLTDQQAMDGLLVADALAARLLAWEPADALAGNGRRDAGTVDLHRAEVHQATGVLSQRLGVPMDEALSRLRAQVFASGRPLAEVAREILHRQLPS